MEPVVSNLGRSYLPTSAAAHAAAESFLARATAWAPQEAADERELAEYVNSTTSARVHGMVAFDCLGMTAVGLMFDGVPEAGYRPTPSDISERLAEKGVKGNAFVPDRDHPVGRRVMELLRKFSQTAEARPLLHGVAGVNPVALEGPNGDILVLSHAYERDGKLVIRAGQSAIRADAAVMPLPEPQKAMVANPPSQRPGLRI